MKTFVDFYMINSQTYNEILMVGVKRGKRGAQLVHSVGIIVRDIMGGQKQVLFFDQDYERKFFVNGLNTHDCVPVDYEKLFGAYTRIDLYKLTGINVNSYVKTDIDAQMTAVLAPTPENKAKAEKARLEKVNKKRKNSRFGNIHGKKFSKPRCKRP